MVEITLEEAIELSKENLLWRARHGELGLGNISCGLITEIPRIGELGTQCGLCQYFKIQQNGECGACPLRDEGYVCCKEYHKYINGNEMERTYWAMQLYKRLVAIDVEELKRKLKMQELAPIVNRIRDIMTYPCEIRSKIGSSNCRGCPFYDMQSVGCLLVDYITQMEDVRAGYGIATQ